MVAQHSDVSTDSPAVALRRRLVSDLAPHLVVILNLTDPSTVVARAACHPVRYGVAAEPLRGPVQRAMSMAWRCASTAGGARNVEVEHLSPISSLVQVHGADWSLVARTGGSTLLLFDGYPVAVVDVSSTYLVDSLVAELLRAAQRTLGASHRTYLGSRRPPRPTMAPPPTAPRRRHSPAPPQWMPEQRDDTGGWPVPRPPARQPVPSVRREGPRHGR